MPSRFASASDKVHNPLRLPRKTTSERPKVVRNPSVFNTFDLEMCFAPQRRALFRHLNFQKWSEPVSDLEMCCATTACFSTSHKSGPNMCVLYILTWKCASRHNGVHFFDISTSKSGPRMVCFVHFDLEMCFAPQRRALFRHLNFQKWSEREVCFVHFDLEMCFAPQRRAIFHLSSGQMAPHPPL